MGTWDEGKSAETMNPAAETGGSRRRRYSRCQLCERSVCGTADLTDKATIELMQQRRNLLDDRKGLCEPLNETEKEDQKPPRINAQYFMQIFDTKKGDSKLRSTQINLQ